MDMSYIVKHGFNTQDQRASYEHLKQEQMASCGLVEAVKLLQEKTPTQLEFRFKIDPAR